MQNIKYHILNTVAVLIFACTASAAINQTAKALLTTGDIPAAAKQPSVDARTAPKPSMEETVSSILDSGIFKIGLMPEDSGTETAATQPPEDVSNLTLMGTVAGPWSIARALIKKNNEKEPGIFALYRVSSDITNDVYGYKLTGIDTDRVYLTENGKRTVLKLFEPTPPPQGKETRPAQQTAGSIRQTLSRAEIKQTAMGDLDNVLRGLVAGPYRKNGKLVGYHLKKVNNENILYRLGMRSGDIIMRLNGKEINSTERLYTMWKQLQSESKITVDIERGGKMMTFDLNIME